LKPKILFVITTPLTANVFLLRHLQKLSNNYCIYLCLNTSLHELLPELKSNVKVIHINIQRKISFYYDLISLIHLFIVCKRINPQVVHSITPKSGLLGMLAAFIAGVPFRWHTFTGQVWVTRKSISRLFFKFIDKCIVFFSTQVFCDSKSQQQFLVKENIVLPNKISVLGYGSISGVDIDRFYLNHEVRSVTRFQLARKTDSCIFLYVGRLSRDKGIF
jgi:glycosyltransferase involved in cell wall biosynthesis